MEEVRTKLKKNDTVMVMSGKDRGKVGRILRIDTKSGRVLVEGINMVKKAVRKKNQQDRGGIIDVEGSIHLSNVMIVDKNGKPTRIRSQVSPEGKKIRVSVKTGEVL